MFKIYGIAIINRDNSPLYLRSSFLSGDNDINQELFHRNIFSLLDSIDNVTKLNTTETDPFLGLLATINSFSYYVYLSSCMLKIIISGKWDEVPKSITWKDAIIRGRLKEIHSIWCISLLNVFKTIRKESYPALDVFLEPFS